MAVRQRKRDAGGGVAGGGSAGESPYAELKRALREAYEAARSGRQGQQEHEVELPELGGLLVKVYAKQYEQEDERKEYAAVLEVFKRGHPDPLCKVELYLRDKKSPAVHIDCDELMTLASRCARDRDCWLSWEEMEDALGLTVWAVNRLAELAGIPAKVEKVGLMEARNTRNDEVNVFPCLQVSASSKSYSVCDRVLLSRSMGGGWMGEGIYRLIPIGEAYVKIAEALMELGEMVWEYIRSREREGAWRIRDIKYWRRFLKLEEVVLRLPDGTEEVLLKPQLPRLEYLGEDFAALFCFYDCSEDCDSELADALRKELEEAWGVVVQAVRRLTEEHDPQYAALAYIALEALGRAGLA